MKPPLTTLLILATLHIFAQTIYLSGGGGLSALSSQWDKALPVVTAGINIEDPCGEKGSYTVGLHYRQRGNDSKGGRTRMQQIQFDLCAQYNPGRFRVGAGAFYALAAKTKTWVKVGSELTPLDLDGYDNGVGVCAFVGWMFSDVLGLRLSYDHGLGNISPFPGAKVTAQGLYLCAQLRLYTKG